MIDIMLVRRCQVGDKSAFEEIYKLCSTKALRTACLIIGKKDIAEDAMQEAFFQCYMNIGKLHDPSRFDVWFNRILIRACKDASIKEKKVKVENIDNCKEKLQGNYNIEGHIEQRERNDILMDAINNLSMPLKSTIVLFYYNDMSIKQIANVMNCFEGTVKSRLHYAKKTLEKELCKMNEKNCILEKGIL